MHQRPHRVEGPSVVVVRNLAEALTVEVEETHETRHLVEFESTEVEELLHRLPVGSHISLYMERAWGRGNCWRAIRPRTTSPDPTPQATPVET